MSKLPIIGTPLSAHATKVMLLGSGELGKEIIIALQRLGIETIHGRPHIARHSI